MYYRRFKNTCSVYRCYKWCTPILTPWLSCWGGTFSPSERHQTWLARPSRLPRTISLEPLLVDIRGVCKLSPNVGSVKWNSDSVFWTATVHIRCHYTPAESEVARWKECLLLHSPCIRYRKKSVHVQRVSWGHIGSFWYLVRDGGDFVDLTGKIMWYYMYICYTWFQSIF